MKAFKSELKKFTSLRSSYVYAVLLLGSIIGTVTLYIGVSLATRVNETEIINFTWSDFSNPGPLFLLIAVTMIGATVAGEVSTKMQAQAFLTQHRRGSWFTARLLLLASFIGLMLLLAVAGAIAVVAVFPNSTFSSEGGSYMLQLALMLFFYGLLAASCGVITGSKVAAVAVPLASLLVVESMVMVLVTLNQKVFGFLGLLSPGARINNIISHVDNNTTEIGFEALLQTQPLWFDITLLSLYTALLLGAAYYFNNRRDAK